VVVPATVGTHRFTRKINADYTIGREYVSDALKRLLDQSEKLAVDIETFGVGKEGRNLKSVSFGNSRHAVILDPRDPFQHDLALRTMDYAKWLVIHNSPYDVPNLHLNDLMPIEFINKVIDTIIYGRLAEPSDIGGHDLLAAGNNYCGLDGEDYLKRAFKMLGMSRETGFREFDLDRIIYVQGAAADVVVTSRLEPAIRKAAYEQITTDHPFVNHGVTGDEAWRLVEREQIVNRQLLRRTCKGVRVDLEYLANYREETSAQREEAERELEGMGVDPGNGDHLIKWMVDHNELPEWYPRTGKTNKLSAQAAHIELLSHPVAQKFVKHKKIVKIEKDYLQKAVDLASLDAHGDYRVYPVTNLLKAATGRAAMADPPLHQYSGPARGVLLPDRGDTWYSCDWAAIEPTLFANMAGEVGAYTHYETWYPDRKNRDTGELGTYGDFYEGIAELARISRKEAKVVLLASLYGEGRIKLASQLGNTPDEAKALQDQIFDGIPRIAEFIRAMKQTARQYQKIMTMSGRIIPVPSGMYDGKWSVQSHKGPNFVCQGSAYDVLAETLYTVEEQGLGDAIYWTLHDEIIISGEAVHDVRKIMETPPDRLCRMSGRVPLLRTDCQIMPDRWMSV
jgi:DNA polymerase I